MINIIKSEYLKHKKTFTKKLIILAPLMTILASLLVQWKYLIMESYNIWAILFLPFTIALLAALWGLQEKKAGNYRNLLIHNVKPQRIWFGKIWTMAIHTLFASLALMILLIIFYSILSNIYPILFRGINISFAQIVVGIFVIWLTTLTLIPIELWVSAWGGILPSIAIGIIGFLVGVMYAAKSYWLFIPWSYAARLMCPIMKIGPNAVALNPGDPLLNSSVIPVGIVLSVLTFIFFSYITSLWFAKREVK